MKLTNTPKDKPANNKEAINGPNVEKSTSAKKSNDALEERSSNDKRPDKTTHEMTCVGSSKPLGQPPQDAPVESSDGSSDESPDGSSDDSSSESLVNEAPPKKRRRPFRKR